MKTKNSQTEDMNEINDIKIETEVENIYISILFYTEKIIRRMGSLKGAVRTIGLFWVKE